MLTRRALNRALLARQMLLERASKGVDEAVEAMIGLQAQSPQTPYVALWSRLVDFDAHDLSAGLEQRRLVRATLMRGTIHLVTSDDFRRMRPAFDAMLARYVGGALGKRLTGVDLDDLVARSHALLDATPSTSIEIGRALAPGWPDHDPADLARAARVLVRLVQIPPRGQWRRTGPAAFATEESWLGRSKQRPQPVADILLRYLRAFGPATAADVRAWSGLAGVADAVMELGDQVVRVTDDAGRELLDAHDGLLPDEATRAPVRFLPEFDNLWLSHADRTRVLPEEHVVHVLRTIASGRPLILVDGFITGAWRVARTRRVATLHIEPFTALTKKARTELTGEGERLLDFVAAGEQHDLAIS